MDLIKMDHQKTLKSFGDLMATTTETPYTRNVTWASTEKDLLVHMQCEEEVFYPALERIIEDEILVAVEEHNLIRSAADDLDITPTDDNRWLAKLKVIKDNVERHIEEEENKILDMANRAFSAEDLEDMAKRFQKAKENMF
ncbi:MAG: hemerythrin domain-containing protein [Methanotrichaceae archaeon]